MFGLRELNWPSLNQIKDGGNGEQDHGEGVSKDQSELPDTQVLQ